MTNPNPNMLQAQLLHDQHRQSQQNFHENIYFDLEALIINKIIIKSKMHHS